MLWSARKWISRNWLKVHKLNSNCEWNVACSARWKKMHLLGNIVFFSFDSNKLIKFSFLPYCISWWLRNDVVSRSEKLSFLYRGYFDLIEAMWCASWLTFTRKRKNYFWATSVRERSIDQIRCHTTAKIFGFLIDCKCGEISNSGREQSISICKSRWRASI